MKAKDILLEKSKVQTFINKKGNRYWREDEVIRLMKMYAMHKVNIYKNDVLMTVSKCEDPIFD